MRFTLKDGRFHMFTKSCWRFCCCALPAIGQAADITGIPKIRRGRPYPIGNTRIRLGGSIAPSVDQLCLNTKGERWTCGVAARDELIKHAENKSWTCHTRQIADRRGRQGGEVRSRRRGHPEMAGAERVGAVLHAVFP